MEKTKIRMCESRGEWLEQRKKGLGGTDAAAILGMSPWRTGHDVWCDKTGLIDRQHESEAMFWGTTLEDLVAKHWRKLNKKKFMRLAEYTLVVHPSDDFLLASPDRLLYPYPAGLEVKTVGARGADFWGEDGGDGKYLPPYVFAQVQHYLMVTQLERWYVAALIGGQQYRQYTVLPDAVYHARAFTELRRFWTEQIIPERPPLVDGSEGSRRLLDVFFPKNTSEIRDIEAADAVELLEQYRHIKTASKTADAELRSVENHVINLIADSDGVAWNGHKITHKSQKGRVNWKGVAEAMNPQGDLKEAHRGPEKRVLRASWAKEGGSCE